MNIFQLGGFGMWPTLALGMVTILAALRYAFTPAKRLLPLLVALQVTTLLFGALGFVTGVLKSCLAISGVPADQRFIVVLGVGESLHNLALAFALMAIAALTATVGAFRVARGAT
jgi:hypothetical protein